MFRENLICLDVNTYVVPLYVYSCFERLRASNGAHVVNDRTDLGAARSITAT